MGQFITGENDLQTWCLKNKREEIIGEWDYEQNDGLTPSDVAYGSNIKRGWVCSKGHKWMQSPNARTLRYHNCPYCSNFYVLKGFNDLESQNPDLAKEWDYEKNIDSPSEVLNGSSHSYWWKCNKGHSWKTSVSKRQVGRGCPYCANKSVWYGFNELETTHPELAKEWDYEKNEGLTPAQLTYGCGKMIWWICTKKHSYQCTVNNRTSNGTGCPYCTNKKVFSGFNDLESWCKNNNQENLLVEWDYSRNEIKPSDVSVYSHAKVWWKCSYCGDVWKAPISTRTRHLNVYGCKKCATQIGQDNASKEQALAGESLKDKYPELLLEWDFKKNTIQPNEKLCGSNKKIWWICSNGHSYSSPVNRRVGQKSGCPICANKVVLKGYNDLATVLPHFIEEWDFKKNEGITPSDVVVNSHLSVWWKCKECGNEWKAMVSSRTRGTGCPRCAREYSSSFPEQVLFFYLKKVYPDAINGDRHLGVEFDIYVPSLKFAFEYDGAVWHKNVNKDIKKNIICEQQGIIIYRIREKECPYLPFSNNCTVINIESEKEKDIEEAVRALFGILNINISINLDEDRAAIYGQYRQALREKSIEFTNPELLQYWDYDRNIIKPSHVYKGSKMKIWWVCSLGHHYQQSVYSKVQGLGCPICHGDLVLEGFNDFETWCKQNKKEYLLKEWDYSKNSVKPTEITKSPKDLFWWVCPKGHSYQSFAYNRIKGYGCPFCAGKKVMKGFNDFLTDYPELEKEWDFEKNDKEPFEYTKGSNKKVFWICSKGHSYEASISHRTSGRGCPFCAGKKVNSGVDDFVTEYPQIASEWDYDKNDINPKKIKGGSNKRVWWKCNYCGFEWQTPVCCRTSQGTGCPSCSSKNNGKARRRKVQNIDTGVIYESITGAAQSMGIGRASIIKACAEKTKTAGGYRWKYY